LDRTKGENATYEIALVLIGFLMKVQLGVFLFKWYRVQYPT